MVAFGCSAITSIVPSCVPANPVLVIRSRWLSNNEVAGLSDEMNTFDQLKLTKPLDLPT
jgi:hypothetical protein